MDDARAAVQAVLSGNFTSWYGLGDVPVSVLVDRIGAVRSVDEANDVVRGLFRYARSTVHRDVLPSPVAIWALHGSETASFLEYDAPPMRDGRETLSAYGRPERTLRDERYKGEVRYAYPGRGITLTFRESPNEDGTAGLIAESVQLYPACGLDDYLRGIGREEGLHPWGAPS